MARPFRKLAADTEADTLPQDEKVRQRAYELYMLRGDEPGSELDDWFQAELEMQAPRDGE